MGPAAPHNCVHVINHFRTYIWYNIICAYPEAVCRFEVRISSSNLFSCSQFEPVLGECTVLCRLALSFEKAFVVYRLFGKRQVLPEPISTKWVVFETMCCLQFHASCMDSTMNTINWNLVFVSTVYVSFESVVYEKNLVDHIFNFFHVFLMKCAKLWQEIGTCHFHYQ